MKKEEEKNIMKDINKKPFKLTENVKDEIEDFITFPYEEFDKYLPKENRFTMTILADNFEKKYAVVLVHDKELEKTVNEQKSIGVLDGRKIDHVVFYNKEDPDFYTKCLIGLLKSSDIVNGRKLDIYQRTNSANGEGYIVVDPLKKKAFDMNLNPLNEKPKQLGE